VQVQVIHVIDAVLLPPVLLMSPVPDIVETAISAGNFTVLVESLQTAGLVDALKGAGPFTVSTDAAFVALLDTLGVTKAELLARDDLADILKYHVLSGSSAMSADLAASQDVTTLEGSKLTVTKDGSAVKAGSAVVSAADISCSNGVIHIIDSVLLPQGDDVDNQDQLSRCSGKFVATSIFLLGFLFFLGDACMRIIFGQS